MWTLFSRQFRRQSALNSLMNDSFTGVRVVKSFGKEEEEVRRFHPANADLYVATLDANRMWASVFPVLQFVMQLGGLAVWAVGGIGVAGGRVTFGTLMSFVSYITMLYNPLQFFSNVIEWWAHCMNSAQRIFEIVDAVPEIADLPDPVRIPRLRGDIALRSVTFAYEPNRPVLREITLEIKAGEMVGLVGHTGAGKSTLVNLITLLYDAQEGSVEIDGLPIRRVAQEDLRAGMGIVLQDTYLFSGSVSENIAYSRPGASLKEIILAAKAANAHDFIVSLPDGYDTVLGRRGVDLSGGERQRLSIARVLLRDPRVLIFDEATSSVDTETEHKIQQAIDRLVAGRTTIAIAHRLSTLRRADRLVILDKGRIAEQGTHVELMQRRGEYYKLVHQERQALKIIAVGDA
jgi:ATP-binding cassette, subfamily B, bacterial